MEEFTTSIFKENELKTKNRKVSRERPFFIGLLITLIGIALNLMDSPYTIHFLLGGTLLMVIGRIVASGKSPSIGHRPLSLRLTKDSVYIGEERLPLEGKENIAIWVDGYKGETISHNSFLDPKASGNDNTMTIKLASKMSEFKFVLESERHRDKLVDYCEANGFEIRGRTQTYVPSIFKI